MDKVCRVEGPRAKDKMKNTVYMMLIAAAVGIAGYFLSSTLSLVIIFGLIAYAVYRVTPQEDRNFVLAVMIAGFVLRVVIAVVMHAESFLKGEEGFISGDDLLYTVKGWAVVFRWEGKTDSWIKPLGSAQEFGMNPFTYVIALFYRIFGFHPAAAKIINCIFGTMIGWVSYLTAKRLFDRRTARIAIVMVTFYPSFVRWSAANLKDPLLMLSYLVCMYILVIALDAKLPAWRFGVLALSVVCLYYFPAMLFFFVAAAAICIVAFFKILDLFEGRRMKRAVIALSCIAVLAAVCFALYIKPKPLVDFLYSCEGKQFIVARSDDAGYFLYSGNFMKDLNRGLVSLPKLLGTVCINAIYFMLTPMPWQMVTKSRLVAFPQMIVWYIILLFSMFGFAALALKKPRTAMLIAVPAALGIIAYSLAEGNMGGAFRHRDPFAPFFIIMASAAWSALLTDTKKHP
jgi:4-amino-4-deoxy-L-arabinose transferase-like glycosyltransferase